MVVWLIFVIYNEGLVMLIYRIPACWWVAMLIRRNKNTFPFWNPFSSEANVCWNFKVIQTFGASLVHPQIWTRCVSSNKNRLDLDLSGLPSQDLINSYQGTNMAFLTLLFIVCFYEINIIGTHSPEDANQWILSPC